MRTRLLVLFVLVGAAQLSCGGTDGDPASLGVLEASPPDPLHTASWPDAVDLGVVVSSEILPSEDIPPPPDFAR